MAKEDDRTSGGRHIASMDGCAVHILMGSKSDIDIARKATRVLEEFEVPYSITVASAHRTPELVESSVKGSSASVFIAVAGLSAALPGVVAAHTQRPVIGVPVSGKVNLDAILSVVQMPQGIPVACVGLDRGDNAALLAVRILAVSDRSYSNKLDKYLGKMKEMVYRSNEEVQDG